MRIAVAVFLLAAATLLILLNVDTASLVAWVIEQQRAFQNQMAAAVRALRSGDPGAYAALLAAAGAYGFVHAIGPGHGKYLIGGVGLGTTVPASRLLGVALASSLAQAIWAIILVYGGFALLELSAQRMTTLAEDVLAPASYLAIASIGLILVWRGVRSLSRRKGREPSHDHHHGHGHEHGHAHAQADCGCHAHGPSPEEVAKLGSLREGLVLIGSIAIRPCTGAIFLLVIAWQMDIRLAGAVAVVVMGLGTAGLTSLVALSSVAARGVAFASADNRASVAVVLPALQVFAGALIVWISVMLLRLAT